MTDVPAQQLSSSPDVKKEDEDDKSSVKAMTMDQELRYWVTQGDEAKIKSLHQQGASVNVCDIDALLDQFDRSKDFEKPDANEEKFAPKITGDYPLHIAASHGLVDTCKLLFYLDAKMENTNRLGSTALHVAVSHKFHKVAKELIDLGADVHAQNKIGNTPLHVACYVADLAMIKLLLDNGAADDLKKINKVYMTPIEYTQKHSEEREHLLSVDPSLHEFIADEEAEEKLDEEEEKTN